ncbi:MAG: HEAT repeat domain-containing protein [bacterium]
MSAVLIILILGLPGSICLASGPLETHLIDRALEAVATQREDLSIRPDLFHNPFAIRCFSTWMRNPVMAPLEAQQGAQNLFMKAEDAFLWIQELAQYGGLYLNGPVSLQHYIGDEIEVSGPIGDAVRVLLGALHAAHIKMSATRKALLPSEIKLLEKYAYPDCCVEKGFGESDAESVRIKELRQTMDIAGRVDRKEICEAATVIIKAVVEASGLLTAGRDGKEEKVNSFSVMTDLGLVEIGGTGPDVHEKDAILIIDCGGNDLYRGGVASGVNGKCSIVLDLEGNDSYLGERYTQACGFWGIGVLFDLKGDDLYRADSCSQGAGLFGIGLLLDGEGSDVYVGERFVQASSAWGLGGLIDLSGEDLYQCQKSGQAYSGVRGVSCLCDLKGNDKYLSGMKAPDPREPDMNKSCSQGFAMGMRSMAAGGFALLADKSGNDLYQCQYFGQGASYWMGVGVLYDEEGKDTYIARRYAQGSGIHFSFGALLDMNGDDHFYSWGVSQGCGHDYGVGVLINETGNDSYCSDWLSMGASNSNGVGIFIDNSGNDGYDSSAGMGVGHLTEKRQSGGIGLFMDAGGTDRYSKKGSDNSLWILNRWGVGVDEERGGKSGMNMLPSLATSPTNEEVKRQKMEEKKKLFDTMAGSEVLSHQIDIEALVSVASHWGFEKKIPSEAKQKLLSLSPQKSLPALIDMLDTPYTSILGEFFTVHAFLALPELVRKTRSPDLLSQERAYYYLGMLKDPMALECCVGALKDSSWRIRAMAIRAIGEILDRGRLQILIPMEEVLKEALKERNPHIIRNYLEGDGKAALALSVLSRALAIGHETYIFYSEAPVGEDKEKRIHKIADLLFNHLDKVLPLVEGYINNIAQSEKIAKMLMACLKDTDPAVRKATAYALGQMNYQPVIAQLTRLLKDSNLWVRDTAVLSLVLFEDEAIQPLSVAMEGETSSFKILSLDALSRIKSDPAKGLIEKYLRDSDENVRRAAQHALCAF